MKSLKSISLILLGIFVVIAGCAQQSQKDADHEEGHEQEHAEGIEEHYMEDHDMAVAVVHPTKDSKVNGWVTFTQEDDGVRVHGEFSGLSEGKHGFHIHQYGDCRAADGTSAGGHFNPDGNDHAARTDSERHMGDMGNITAGSNGNASVDYVDSVIEMDEIMGRGIVIHGGEDDLSSQPSGAAGPRMACGVIGVANADFAMDDSM